MPATHPTFLTLSLSALAVAFGLACGRSKTPPAPPLAVQVAMTDQKDVPVVHEWVGTVDGFVNAEIRPQVEGFLVKQVYREGFPVRRGQVLFQIDPRQFQAVADQARATLARDQATLEKARRDVDRYTPLAAQKAISQEELDNATSALDQAQAVVAASRAAYEKARLNLEWTRVVSPIDGIAGVAKAQVGDLVNGQSVMTTVSRVDPVKVCFQANETEYMGWAKGWNAAGAGKGSLELVLSDGTVYPHRGDPFMTDRNIDLSTGTIALAAVFPNPGSLLRPGQYAKVRAALGTERNAVLVPQRAVWEIQGQPQVAVVDGGNRVSIQPVTLGTHLGSQVVVEKGLPPGSRVVVEGVQKVAAGMLVQPNQAGR